MTTEPFAARSDTGLVRTGNEDRYLAAPPVFAVADGMGGHQAGEVASAIAVDALEAAAASPADLDGVALAGALERSNREIREQARRRPDLAGMGTTCTVIVVGGRAIDIAHVGDTRVYLFRAGLLRQLTEDHTLVAQLVRDGALDAKSAAADTRRNVITRALGADDALRVDRLAVAIEPGDRLLLCSDGLHGQVDDATIAAALAGEADPIRAADRLVDLANAAGGDDNVTVVVIDPERLPPGTVVPPAGGSPAGAADDVPATRATGPRRRPAPRPTSVVLIGVLAVALVVAVLGALGGGAPGAASPTAAGSPTATALATVPASPTAGPSSPVVSAVPSPSSPAAGATTSPPATTPLPSAP